MNIFWLDDHPKQAAEYHCDKHCVKMILESAQMLCTAQRIWHRNSGVFDIPEIFYGTTHENHPCSIWTRTNDKNYYWLWCLLYWLSVEYSKRYKRVHETTRKLLKPLMELPPGIPKVEQHTPPALAMPVVYHHTDPVIAYRAYYIGDKHVIAKWSHSQEPYWWPSLKDVYEYYARQVVIR